MGTVTQMDDFKKKHNYDLQKEIEKQEKLRLEQETELKRKALAEVFQMSGVIVDLQREIDSDEVKVDKKFYKQLFSTKIDMLDLLQHGKKNKRWYWPF